MYGETVLSTKEPNPSLNFVVMFFTALAKELTKGLSHNIMYYNSVQRISFTVSKLETKGSK